MARQMKDSGVEWIGEIPETWTLAKGKSLYDITTGKLDANAENPAGEYPFFTCSMLPKRIDTYAFDCEALLVAGNGIVGFTQYYNGKFNAYQRTYVLSSFRQVEPSYLKYYVSNNLSTEVAPNSVGSVIQFIKLGDLQNFHIVFPTLNEQQRIAAFLDRRCAEIDAVVERTKATIEEYKKLKQAVITEAVTKGVRGPRKMKDSGIEWIGEIPEGWSIRKLFRVIDAIGDIDHYMPESVTSGIPYLMTGDLRENISQVRFEQCKQVSFEDFLALSKKIKATMGDVIFARYATIGTVCYVDSEKDFLVSYSCLTIKPTPDLLLGKFLFYYLKSTPFYEEVRQYINSNTQANVGLDSMTKAKVTLPPVCEQEEIIAYLDEKCAALDAIIARKTALLTELETYKKSLIYEYVTGKKEVP